jgi:hypothetical protein
MTPLAPLLTAGTARVALKPMRMASDCCLPSLPNASARSHHSCMSSSSMRS